MTYLEYAIEYECPGEILTCEGASLDPNTYISSDTGCVGCRGITCEQCWNQEIMKPLDK